MKRTDTFRPFDTLSVSPGICVIGFSLNLCGSAVGVSRREGALDPIVGQEDVDHVWHGRDQGDEEGGCGSTSGLSDQLHESAEVTLRPLRMAVTSTRRLRRCIARPHVRFHFFKVATGFWRPTLSRRRCRRNHRTTKP